MTSSHNRLRLFSLLLGGCVLGACTASPLAPETDSRPDAEELARGSHQKVAKLAQGLHPIVAVQNPADGLVRVELRLKPVGVHSPVASYQGQLSYSAELLPLERVEFPAGVTGTSHEARTGTLRFIGAAVAGLSGEILAVVYFRADSAPRIDAFSLVVEEVAATGDLQDLSSWIVAAAPAALASR